MRALLLDTHVLLWALTRDPRLTVTAQTLLTRASEVVVSAASLWEMSIKASLGKLTLPSRFGLETLVAQGYRLLAVTPEHALQVRALPPLHADPFDRMLVAQAQLDRLTLVSHDAALRQYDVALEWI